jgi:hypothetical protein
VYRNVVFLLFILLGLAVGFVLFLKWFSFVTSGFLGFYWAYFLDKHFLRKVYKGWKCVL